MGNVMNLLFIFGVFLCMALLWYQVLSMSSEESVCLSAIFIIIAVFVAGAAGNAKYSYYAVGILAFAGILCFVFNFSVVKKEKCSLLIRFFDFFNPSVFFICVLFIYAVIAFKGALFTYPDEISQWGVAAKYMHETGRLPYGTAFPADSTTLSTATMFQYFWTGLRSFSERNCFVGNFLLAVVPIFLPFRGVRWKEWKRMFGYTSAVFLAMNVLSYVKYYTLLQDYVLPLWTGGVIAWLVWAKGKKINWLLLAGALMCIGAMKSMVGPLFTLIIILVVFVRQIIIYEPKRIKDLVNVKTISISILLLGSAFFLNRVWVQIIGNSGSVQNSVYYAPEKNLFHIIRGVIDRAFYMVTGSVETFPNMSYFVFALLVIMLLFILKERLSDEKDRKLFSVVISLYAVGFVLYLLVMLYAYIYVFGAADAMSVAGLDRYLAYYMLVGCVPVVSLFFLGEKFNRNKYITKYFPILLIFVLSFGTGDKFVNKVTSFYLDKEESDANSEEKSIYQLRMEARDEKKIIESLSGTEGKVFLLGTLKMDEAKVLSYELGERYIWSENSYRIYTRYRSDMTIYQDIARYPDLVDVFQHEYIWCRGVEDDEDRYLGLSYMFHLREVKEGAFYRLKREKNGLTTEYLGNIKELMPEDEEE